PLPGIHVNGRLTSGENIGDNGGLQVAHHSYLLSLNGRRPPTIDGFSADQRFFLGWAQIWRSQNRDAALRNRILTDPHSPEVCRTNGTAQNMDLGYAAFNVGEFDHLYLPPADRVLIW